MVLALALTCLPQPYTQRGCVTCKVEDTSLKIMRHFVIAILKWYTFQKVVKPKFEALLKVKYEVFSFENHF